MADARQRDPLANAVPIPELFNAVGTPYATGRPTYPAWFFQAFAARSPNRALAWDCACGSGQASGDLAEHFSQVVATDAAAGQLAEAIPHPRVQYRQATATASGLADHSVDAVLVAQAVHWFAGAAFNAEVRRVARHGATMAWIGYRSAQLDSPAPSHVLQRFLGETLAPWWPPQRRHVEQSLAGLPFPGKEWPFPTDQWIERQWDLPQLIRYLNSLSPLAAARRASSDPLPQMLEDLRSSWPQGGEGQLTIRWPLIGRWGKIQPSG